MLSDDDLIADQVDGPFNEGNDPPDEELHNSHKDEYHHNNLLSELDDGSDDASDEDEADEGERANEEEDPGDDGHAVVGAKPNDPDNNTLDDDHDEEPDNMDEDEFEEVESNTGHLTTMKWIKLLVSHFSSAYMLIWSLPINGVSLQILKSPQVGIDLMPWKELLLDSTYFRLWSHTPGSRLWNNEEIAKFLESGTKSNHRHTFRLAQDSLNTWQGILNTHQSSSDNQPSFDSLVQIVSQMRDETDVPGCKATARDILKILQKKADSGIIVDILADSARTAKVTNHLLNIIDLCKIFAKLSTTTFSGSLHCEAALGTLISTPAKETHPQYSSLLAELQVSHAVYDLHPVFPPHFC